MTGKRCWVAGSSTRAWLAATTLLLAACNVGTGRGEINATVSAPGCGLEDASFEIDPSFFAANRVENVDFRDDLLEIRVQRNSDFEDQSDGIDVIVHELNRVERELLGEPLELGAPRDERIVDLTLYLNKRCAPESDELPVNYVATSGTIVFDAIYAPAVDNDRQITAEFDDVRVEDPKSADVRHGQISGQFRFLFTRGRPAQRFPTPNP